MIRKVTLALACALSITSIQAQQTYNILSTYPKTEPVSFMDGEGKYSGFDADLLAEIEKRSNIKFKITVSPSFRQALETVKEGKADAFIASLSITPARLETYEVSVAYIQANPVMIISKDPAIQKLDDLRDKRVAVLAGSTHEKWIRELKGEQADDGSIVRETSTFLTIKAVVQDKADATIGDDLVVALSASRYKDYGLLTATDDSKPKDSYGILMTKGQTELKQAVDKAIQEMHEDGTMDRLVQKWWGEAIK